MTDWEDMTGFERDCALVDDQWPAERLETWWPRMTPMQRARVLWGQKQVTTEQVARWWAEMTKEEKRIALSRNDLPEDLWRNLWRKLRRPGPTEGRVLLIEWPHFHQNKFHWVEV